MTYAVSFDIDLGLNETGLTLTATITTLEGAVVASGVPGWAERLAAPGWYSGRYAAFADDTSYIVEWLSGAMVMSQSVVTPADAETPYSRAGYLMNPHVGGSAQT